MTTPLRPLRGKVARPQSEALRPPVPMTASGLYDPTKGQDSCGVGFIANLSDEKSHQIVADGLKILENLTHRGASGADPLVGDGAGMLTQLPHRFFAEEAEALGFALPQPGHYAVGMVFFPQDAKIRAEMAATLERSIVDEGMHVLGWRDVPVDNSSLSPMVTATEPYQRQVFIGRPADCADEESYERRLYIMRKRTSGRIVEQFGSFETEFYFASLSSPDHRLQGDVPRLSARRLLSRPQGSALRIGAGSRASALLDQHLPVLALGAPLSDDRP